MPFVWSFSTYGAPIAGRLSCWPIVPGSITIRSTDGPITKILTDNGDGTLSGDGGGLVDYDYGWIELDFTTPLPSSGTEILADYEPAEGGCVSDCAKCATHYLRLDITPGTISGSDEFTLSDAWSRLFKKLRRDVKPIHVEFLSEFFEEYFLVSIGFRFDIIPSDEEVMDTAGFHTEFDDTSW